MQLVSTINIARRVALSKTISRRFLNEDEPHIAYSLRQSRNFTLFVAMFRPKLNIFIESDFNNINSYP